MKKSLVIRLSFDVHRSLFLYIAHLYGVFFPIYSFFDVHRSLFLYIAHVYAHDFLRAREKVECRCGV